MYDSITRYIGSQFGYLHKVVSTIFKVILAFFIIVGYYIGKYGQKGENMEQKIKQEAPATLLEAYNHGYRQGLELNDAKKAMRKMIAHRLQCCRMDARLTQQELSIQVDINHLTYRGYENCRSDIPIVYLIRLADFFGISLDYLTGRTDDKNSVIPHKTADDDMSARIEQLEQIVEKLQAQRSNPDL